jgi:hypothetical protein
VVIWKKTLAVSLFGIALHSSAQVSVRPEVLNELQLLQKMVASKNLTDAFSKADALREKANLNIEERKYLENINQNASLASGQFERAIVSLEYLYESKNISKDEKIPFLERLVYANQQLKNSSEVVRWSKIYLTEKGGNQSIRKLYLQSLSEAASPEAVVNEANFLKKDLGLKLTEPELLVLANAQFKLKNEDGYFSTLALLIEEFPKNEYWQNLISQLTSKSNISSKILLEWYRVFESSGAMKDAEDWLFYAETALKAGLPNEAVEVFKVMKTKGLQLSVDQTKNSNLLEKRVLAAALEDDKFYKKLSQGAIKDTELIQLADLNLAKQNWTAAIDSYKKAAEKSEDKQRGWIKLHLGIAHLKNGDTDAASQLFLTDSTDSQLSRLNRMWSILAKK